MGKLAIILMVVATGCGRWGFGDHTAPDGQAPPDSSIPGDDAMIPDRLQCGAPARLQVGALTDALTIGTAHGYDVFAVDANGDVHGFSYQFAVDGLVPTEVNVALASNATGPLGSIANGDDVVLAELYGRPNASGTSLIPLDKTLGARGTSSMHDAWFVDAASLARTDTGSIAFLGALTTGEVDAVLITADGTTTGAAHLMVDGGEGPSIPTIANTGSGFLIVWGSNAMTPNAARAMLIDDHLAITTPATTVSFDPDHDAVVPRAAYAAASSTYVFAWAQKNAANNDEIWISIRDASLVETVAPIRIADGYWPQIASDGTGFLIVWEDDALASHIGAARVSSTGTLTPLSVPGSGGTAVDWGLVERKGQPALAWSEAGGNGPDFWLDPLCD